MAEGSGEAPAGDRPAPDAAAAASDETADDHIAGEASEEADTLLPLVGHLYRGLLDRATKWRDRLDRTVHWSVLVVGSVLTWTFSSPDRPHVILLLAMLVIVTFLAIDARRYRFYDVWRSQLRVLEENVFAHAIDPRGLEEADWRRRLGEDLRRPAFKIPMREALGRRLRRAYMALLGVLLLAWLLRLLLGSSSWREFADGASIWWFPGELVLALVLIFHAALLALTLWPQPRRAKGHIRDREEAVDLTKDEP